MNRPYAWIILLAALMLYPFLAPSAFWLNFGAVTLMFATLAQGWNILGGYGGQYSFGHALFFGVGAYATAVWQIRFGLDPWSGFALGVALGAGVGAFFGALSFRSGLRGSYFALITLAFAEVFRILAASLAFTGGGQGLLIPLNPGAAHFQFVDRRLVFGAAALIFLAALAATLWLERSRFGARLVALRENEDAARALGVDVFRVKLGAIALSGAIAAAAGALYAQMFLYIDAGIAFGSHMSVEALVAPIVGGPGTLFGPLIGTIALRLLHEGAVHVTGGAPGLGLALFGVILLLALRFMPDGLVGLARRWRAALARSPA